MENTVAAVILLNIMSCGYPNIILTGLEHWIRYWISLYERLSGSDGITVQTNGEPLFLDVSIQQVVLKDESQHPKK